MLVIRGTYWTVANNLLVFLIIVVDHNDGSLIILHNELELRRGGSGSPAQVVADAPMEVTCLVPFVHLSGSSTCFAYHSDSMPANMASGDAQKRLTSEELLDSLHQLDRATGVAGWDLQGEVQGVVDPVQTIVEPILGILDAILQVEGSVGRPPVLNLDMARLSASSRVGPFTSGSKVNDLTTINGDPRLALSRRDLAEVVAHCDGCAAENTIARVS